MFRKPQRFASVLAALLGSCAVTEAQAQVIVVPNALATADGNSFNDTPSGTSGPFRIMQCFDASQFAALTGPVLMTQFAWRPDTLPGPSGPHTFTFQLFASTTTRSLAGLSTTFADNIGADNMRVFSGTVSQFTANLPGPGNTRQFDIVVLFTTPFLYDPSVGNLAIDFQASTQGGPAIRRDEVIGNSTIRSLFNPGSATATTGSLFDVGLVSQFTFQPVPEPTSIALVSVAACGMLGSAWRRWRRAGKALA